MSKFIHYNIDDLIDDGEIIRDIEEFSNNPRVEKILLYLGYMVFEKKQASFSVKEAMTALKMDRNNVYRTFEKLCVFSILSKKIVNRGTWKHFTVNRYVIDDVDMLKHICESIQKRKGWDKDGKD